MTIHFCFYRVCYFFTISLFYIPLYFPLFILLATVCFEFCSRIGCDWRAIWAVCHFAQNATKKVTK